MTHDELREELYGLVVSLDDHVDAISAAGALRALAERVEREGLEVPA